MQWRVPAKERLMQWRVSAVPRVTAEPEAQKMNRCVLRDLDVAQSIQERTGWSGGGYQSKHATQERVPYCGVSPETQRLNRRVLRDLGVPMQNPQR